MATWPTEHPDLATRRDLCIDRGHHCHHYWYDPCCDCGANVDGDPAPFEAFPNDDIDDPGPIEHPIPNIGRYLIWGTVAFVLLLAAGVWLRGCVESTTVGPDLTYPQHVEQLPSGSICQVIDNPHGRILMPSPSCPEASR